MDQASAQTEKIASYETSRTRRSIVDGNVHSDDSNNDEEYATSGFYVREKTTGKKPDSASATSKKSDDAECKENGVSPETNAALSSVENGEDSRDGESSRNSKEGDNTDKIEDLDKQSKKNDQSGTKEDIDSENDEKSDSLMEQGGEKEENETATDNTEQNNKENGDNCEKIEDKSLENKVAKESDEKKEPSTVELEVKKVDDESKVKDSNKPNKSRKESSDIESDHNEKKNDETAKNKNELKQDKKSKKGDKKNKIGAKEKVDGTEEKVEAKEKSEVDDIEEKIEAKEKSKGNHTDEEVEAKEKSKGDDKAEQVEDKEKSKEDDIEEKVEAKEKCKADDIEEKVEAKETSKGDDTEEKVKAKEKSNEDDKKENSSDQAKSTSETEKESEGSILKEQLEKSAFGNSEENIEMEMDEDFDPSLLCPDISMDVDEAPVITNTENASEDGSTSPLPYEATFSTLVDEITGAEVQVDLTPEEMELRQKMYGANNLVQTTKIHCTACNIHLGSALTGANNRFVHPLLKVLICKNCYHFYTSGEFEKDEDGSELYCRWCGQGGQVLCCSSCEFVFCKRCIRNNFGPKKFKEIRDSDDWNCFRCDRGQLSNLRASCAEFMEYYRTELARAQALSQTNPELMTTDYTTCCKGGNEKKDEVKTPAQPKTTRKKKREETDPDYHPIVEEEIEPPKKKFGTSTPTGGPGYTVIPPSVRPIVPKPPAGQVVRPIVMQGQKQQNQGQVFKVGSTTFRAKAPSNGQGYTVQRPTVTQGQKSNSPGYITIPPSAAPKTTSPGYITIPPSAAPKTTTPGYIKIVPQRMQGPRPTSTYTVVSGTSNGKPTFTTVRPKQPPQMPSMKHEWFEKTVRAAARVNSNLSYTLTQLNRQQSQANSVEALAMVHNKLQEVLSTSINSLIQIRKNLRTEFISGIKNIKFPAKPAPIPPTTGPIVVKDDDDVIFVSPPTTVSSLPPPPPLVLSSSVSLTKKTPIQNTSDPFADPKPSTSGFSAKPNNATSLSKPPMSTPAKGGFLKVRSFTSLQSVPSECITIPDDPPASSDVRIIEEEDPLKITDDDNPKDDKEEPPKSPLPEISSTFDEFMVYNINDEPTPAIKKMLGAVVMVKKSRVVDEIIKAQGLPIVKGKEDVPKEKENDQKGKEGDSEKKENESNKEENDKETESGKDKEKKEKSEKKEDEVDNKEKEETVKEDSAKSKEKS